MGRKQHSKFVFEKLERRLLLNADPAMLSLAGGQAGAMVDAVTAVFAQPESGLRPDVITSEQFRQEIVFVDGGIDAYQQLIADLRSQADDRTRQTVVLLDPGRDGIAQISAYLNQSQDIDAVHVFSHGSDGAMNLGNTRLSADTLDEHAADIAGWQQALSGEADLLFYGCNLASGRNGQALIDTISSLTGADVAASEDLTGIARFGGDWHLEYTKGKIETREAINPGVQPQWSGVLATFTVNTTSDTVDSNPGDGVALDGSGNTSLRAAIMEANALGGAHQITLGAGTYSLTLGSDGDDNAEHGDLDIRTKVNITGAGTAVTVINGAGLDRVFHLPVDAADLTLNNLTVQGGNINNKGGGIYVEKDESKIYSLTGDYIGEHRR